MTHFSVHLVGIKPDFLYSVAQLSEITGAEAGTVRAHLTRGFKRVGIDPLPDKITPGRARTTHLWRGWKIQATIKPEYLTYGQARRIDAQFAEKTGKQLYDVEPMATVQAGTVEPTNGSETGIDERPAVGEILQTQPARVSDLRKTPWVVLALAICAGLAAMWWNDSVNQLEHASLETLRAYLVSEEWAPYRPEIIANIADHTADDVLWFPDGEMMNTQHIGTAAFTRGESFIVFTSGVARLGSWLSVAGKSGYVSEILPGLLTLTNGEETHALDLPQCVVFNQREPWPYAVTINGPGFLPVLAELNGWALPDEDVILYGNYAASSPREFIHLIREHIGISIDGDQLVFHEDKTPRACIGFGEMKPWWLTAGDLCALFSDVGIEINGPSSAMNQRVLFTPSQAGPTVAFLTSSTGATFKQPLTFLPDLGD